MGQVGIQLETPKNKKSFKNLLTNLKKPAIIKVQGKGKETIPNQRVKLNGRAVATATARRKA